MQAEQREHAQEGHQQIPFGHHQQGIDHARSRLIEGLEGRQTPNSMVNPAGPPTNPRDSIDPASPFQMAGGVVLVRPFLFQERLGKTVARLLPQIGANRIPPVMPDHRRRTETQRPAALLQSPADVHVVARNAELRIESSDRLETRFAKRHVAARDVFRFPIGKQNVSGAARRVGDTLGDGTVVRVHMSVG